MTSLHIRTMDPPDLDFAAACTAAEGWLTETRQSFDGFYAYDPAGCFVAELDGKRVGICVANAIQNLKKVCMYITKKDGGDGAVREVIELIMKSRGVKPEDLLK